MLLVAVPGFAQPQEPFPDETVAQLLTAALYQYFDPASRFEVSASGSRLAGDLLAVEDLLISGKPVVRHGLRGEVLTHLSGLEMDLAALTSQTFRAHRVREATVVSKTTADAVQDALGRLSASVLSPRIRFQEGSFTVTATIRRESGLYPMEARGTLVVVQAQRVYVALSEVKVSGGGCACRSARQGTGPDQSDSGFGKMAGPFVCPVASPSQRCNRIACHKRQVPCHSARNTPSSIGLNR